MSTLEQELVFELMENGSNAKDILEIAENMRNPNISKIPPINLNQKRVEQAIQRYEFKKDYETFKKNKGSIKKEIKRKKRELIEQEIARLKEDPATLKVKIKKKTVFLEGGERFVLYNCYNCHYILKNFNLQRTYLQNLKNKIFVKRKETEKVLQ